MRNEEIIGWEEVMPAPAKYFSKHRDATVVFDLGGSYFRSALYVAKEGLQEVHQRPALSFYTAPNLSAAELKQGLFRYLVNTANFYANHFNTQQIAISLGAALDGQHGTIYGSGPLWGKDTSSFDLLTLLRMAAPQLNWYLMNDVTAGLIHYVSHAVNPDIRKVLLMTISTGIACRLVDTRNQHIALDKFGLQGEVGHLPVSLCFQGQQIKLKCDCGGCNHLAAFSSGRGLHELTGYLAKLQPLQWQTSKLAEFHSAGLNSETALQQALEYDDEFSRNLLHLATQPIADILRNAIALDPEIDQIVLTGGVVFNLAKHYRNMLMQHLTKQGLYLSSDFDPALFERRIVFADNNAVNNLIGAALYAKNTKRKYHA